MDVKDTSPLDWQEYFDKWWDNHSKLFVVGGDGHQVDTISPASKDEKDLARAAARSAFFHVYDRWKMFELMKGVKDVRT